MNKEKQAKKVRICSLKLVTPNGVRIECGSINEAINFLQKLEHHFGTKFRINGMPEQADLSSDAPFLTLAELEAAAIRKALAANNGNKKATALSLGIARATLDSKLETHGIQIQKSVT